MHAGVDQKVLDDAELIALVSRKLPGSLEQSSLTSLKQRLLAKGESPCG
jgi:hypothetical protein